MSSSDEEDAGFRFPLRMRPTKKYKLADEATLHKILQTIPGRRSSKPEFQEKDYIPPGVTSKDNLVFKCQEPNCTAVFSNGNSLKLHQNKHKDRKLKCSFCNLIFKAKEELTSHLDDFHPNLDETPDADPLQCKKCGKVTRDKMALWRHVRESHRGPPKPCPHCGVLFNRPDNLKEHLKYKHPPEGVPTKIYSCEVCKKQFLYKTSFRLHVKKIHRGEESKSLRCVLCRTVYGCKVSYNIHMNTVHINPVFHHCLVCGVKFRNTSKLNRHNQSKAHKTMKRKLGRKASSSLDEVKVETLYGINSRRKAVAGAAQMTFTNEELIDLCRNSIAKIVLRRVDEDLVQRRCKKGAKVASDPKQETRKHHHLNCIYCWDSQPTLEAVKKHEAICFLKIRSGKLIICPQCNKEFDKPFKLRRHMSVHSEERPYSCSHCDASFKGKRTMEDHIRKIHFGIPYPKPKVARVFSCNFEGCQKQYKSAEMLRIHVGSQHLGIRQTCGTCGKKYKNQFILRKHVKTVHVESPTPTLLLCRPCNRAYKTRLAMLGHFKTRRHRLKVQEARREFAKKKETTTRRSRRASRVSNDE